MVSLASARGEHRASADLTWFYSVGASAFERSTCGPMLERAALYALEPSPAREVTARPMHETRPVGGVEYDEAVLARYGDLSRRMLRLRERDPLAVRALELAFGHTGACWAASVRGRCVALFVLVPDGQALLRRARRKGSTLPDADLVRVEVALADVSAADPHRVARVAGATLEARKLLNSAVKAWL
jgi:hypothetical protein